MIPSPRRRLEEWGGALPGLWRAVEAQRGRYAAAGGGAEVFVPLEAAAEATIAALLAGGHAPPRGPADLSRAALTTQCLAAWRMTQGIYRIDPTLYAALIDTPLTGDIPGEILLRLPEWCVYIETPGMTVPVGDGGPAVPVAGLWYWLDAPPEGGFLLCIGIDAGRRPPLTVQHVPLSGTLDEALAAILRQWQAAAARGTAAPPPPGYGEAARTWLPPALSLVLYLCSTAADITGRGRPGNPAVVRTRRHGLRLLPADGPRTWDVGQRLGAALRAAAAAPPAAAGGDAGRHVRPHVRRAHWHTYLRGARTAPQRELRWLPPIAVAVDDPDALPATIRRVIP